MNMIKLDGINRLQVPTWSWLHINSASIAVPETFEKPYSSPPFDAKYSGLIKLADMHEKNNSSSCIQQYVAENAGCRLHITIPPNTAIEEVIHLSFLLDEANPVVIDEIWIEAEENSSATVMIQYASSPAGVFHGKSAEITVAKNASLKIIQSQILGKEQQHLDRIHAQVDENGKLEIILAEVGASSIFSECDVVLAGKNATANVHGIYVGSQADNLDVSYRLEFGGEQTNGLIDVKGILLGNARKVMKSTLDFKTGAKGAKGKEEENVVTISDTAVNISSPLLLCGEDDVEGIHATSIGQIDESKQFYLMSRGFTGKEAKILLIEAAMTPVLDKIPDQKARESLLALIRGHIYDE